MHAIGDIYLVIVLSIHTIIVNEVIKCCNIVTGEFMDEIAITIIIMLYF